MSVASLVLGILSLVFCWVPILCWILPILGIVFGAVGIKKTPNKKGMAIAGLVLSITALAIWFVIFGLAGCVAVSLMM